MALRHCRVVLVETLFPGNLGATARVMRNLGLEDLVLVNPVADPADRRAREMSTHGEEILERARIVSEFGEAVSDCVTVVGTSARGGGLFRRQTVGTPEEIMPRLAETLQKDIPAALVFGTETNGLTDEVVTRCQHLVHIPAEETYSSLNLAQAVAICLYELRRSWQKLKPQPDLTPEWKDLPATFEAQEHLFAHLRLALEEIHFLYGEKADSLMHALRHLLGKANLSVMETKLLHGLARQICWYVAHHSSLNIARGLSSDEPLV